MLFNSYAFLFQFLPAVVGGFLILFFFDLKAWALAWLTLASLYFYSRWNVWNLPLLLASIGVNFQLGRMIGQGKRAALYVGVAANLLLLGWFKYAGFFSGLVGIKTTLAIALPLAISFFTFQQIAYLVDIHRQTIRPFAFSKYLLFVTFFPHLIAGPIMHYREMMPQFSQLTITRAHARVMALGVMILSVGLFKKVVMADQFAAISDAMFAMATAAQPMTAMDAWQGMLAYTFQIYFDFSGYAEMAIGLGLLFGIWLPINFNSPYKSHSIVEFWRRWHITLSSFLRDYVYIPLGGNRRGQWHQANNLMITMLLGGLWHGAGWTFIWWGALHGFLLFVHHRLPKFSGRSLPRPIAIPLTFLTVALLWVLFRSTTPAAAGHFLAALWQAPDWLKIFARPNFEVLGWMSIGFLVVWGLPGTLQWLRYTQAQTPPGVFQLRAEHGLMAGVMLFVSLKVMASGPSQSFIYFVF